MSVVDVSRIPNNNKFDPVREAILQLEGIIESETAGVFSVNGQQGTLTIAAGANTSVSTSNGVITISSTASTGTLDNTLTLTAGDGITLSSPSVFDGSADVNIVITNDDRPNAGILTIVAGSGLTTATAVNWDNEPQTWEQQGRIWSVSEGNTFSANELNDKSVTLQHAESSSATSTTNAFGVVLQNLSIDNFGHVQSFGNLDLDTRYVQLTDSRIPNWTAAYNDKINSATFSTATGIITLNQQDGGTVTVDIDGRFLLSTDARIANWDTAYSWGDHALEGYLTSFTETDPTVPSHVKAITTTNISNWNAAYNDKINSASFNTSTGVLTLTQQDLGTVTVDLDGRYLESASANTANWDSAYNDTITAIGFSTSTGILTLTQRDLGTLTVDLDGKYLDITAKAADSNLLDGLDSTYFLNYNNLTNKPTIPTVNNNTITIGAGAGMTGGGAFTVNQSFNETITISHADTSAQGSVNNSGRTYIQDVILDTYGHVIGLTSATETVVDTNTQRTDEEIRDVIGAALVGAGATTITVNDLADTITISSTDTNTTYSAGAALTLSGTTFSHADTSTQASVNNSGTTFIQDVTLDTYGHVTGLASASVTIPTVYNSLITVNSGAGLTGSGSFGLNQSSGTTITLSHADTSAQGSVNNSGGTVIQDISLDTYGHITSIGSANLDGRYLLIGGKAADADLLDGLDSTYYLDYNNLTNKPTTTVANNNTITIAGTGGLTGGGSFTVNQSFDETIFVSHADTSALNGTYGSTDDTVKIDTITVDGNGHITAITTGPIAGGGGGGVSGTGTTNFISKWSGSTSLTNSRIYDNGTNVGIGTSSPIYPLDVVGVIRSNNDIIAFSDERVKENIETISSATEKIRFLRGVTFNRINETKRSMGVIAQEVERIIPEVVHTDEDGMKAVAYGNMVGLLIEAIKEQQHEIEHLKAQVKHLMSK